MKVWTAGDSFLMGGPDKHRRYVVTRVTKAYIWARWDAYGRDRRGLSHKYTPEMMDQYDKCK